MKNVHKVILNNLHCGAKIQPLENVMRNKQLQTTEKFSKLYEIIDGKTNHTIDTHIGEWIKKFIPKPISIETVLEINDLAESTDLDSYKYALLFDLENYYVEREEMLVDNNNNFWKDSTQFLKQCYYILYERYENKKRANKTANFCRKNARTGRKLSKNA